MVVVLTSNPALRMTSAAASGVLEVQVGEHDVLAGADAPGDRLADRSGADDDDAPHPWRVSQSRLAADPDEDLMARRSSIAA